MCEAGGIRFDIAVLDGIGSEVSLALKVADATNLVQTSYQGCLVVDLNISKAYSSSIDRKNLLRNNN